MMKTTLITADALLLLLLLAAMDSSAAVAAEPSLGPAAPDTGPWVGVFKMAPAASALGAYRNDSLNTWGGALLLWWPKYRVI